MDRIFDPIRLNENQMHKSLTTLKNLPAAVAACLAGGVLYPKIKMDSTIQSIEITCSCF